MVFSSVIDANRHGTEDDFDPPTSHIAAVTRMVEYASTDLTDGSGAEPRDSADAQHVHDTLRGLPTAAGGAPGSTYAASTGKLRDQPKHARHITAVRQNIAQGVHKDVWSSGDNKHRATRDLLRSLYGSPYVHMNKLHHSEIDTGAMATVGLQNLERGLERVHMKAISSRKPAAASPSLDLPATAAATVHESADPTADSSWSMTRQRIAGVQKDAVQEHGAAAWPYLRRQAAQSAVARVLQEEQAAETLQRFAPVLGATRHPPRDGFAVDQPHSLTHSMSAPLLTLRDMQNSVRTVTRQETNIDQGPDCRFLPRWLTERGDFQAIAHRVQRSDRASRLLFVKQALATPGAMRTPGEVAIIVRWLKSQRRFASLRPRQHSVLARSLTLHQVPIGAPLATGAASCLFFVLEGALSLHKAGHKPRPRSRGLPDRLAAPSAGSKVAEVHAGDAFGKRSHWNVMASAAFHRAAGSTPTAAREVGRPVSPADEADSDRARLASVLTKAAAAAKRMKWRGLGREVGGLGTVPASGAPLGLTPVSRDPAAAGFSHTAPVSIQATHSWKALEHEHQDWTERQRQLRQQRLQHSASYEPDDSQPWSTPKHRQSIDEGLAEPGHSATEHELGIIVPFDGRTQVAIALGPGDGGGSDGAWVARLAMSEWTTAWRMAQDEHTQQALTWLKDRMNEPEMPQLYRAMASIPKARLKSLAAALQEVELPAGSLLWSQGDPAHSLVIVIEGQVLLSHATQEQHDERVPVKGADERDAQDPELGSRSPSTSKPSPLPQVAGRAGSPLRRMSAARRLSISSQASLPGLERDATRRRSSSVASAAAAPKRVHRAAKWQWRTRTTWRWRHTTVGYALPGAWLGEEAMARYTPSGGAAAAAASSEFWHSLTADLPSSPASPASSSSAGRRATSPSLPVGSPPRPPSPASAIGGNAARFLELVSSAVAARDLDSTVLGRSTAEDWTDDLRTAKPRNTPVVVRGVGDLDQVTTRAAHEVAKAAAAPTAGHRLYTALALTPVKLLVLEARKSSILEYSDLLPCMTQASECLLAEAKHIDQPKYTAWNPGAPRAGHVMDAPGVRMLHLDNSHPQCYHGMTSALYSAAEARRGVRQDKIPAWEAAAQLGDTQVQRHALLQVLQQQAHAADLGVLGAEKWEQLLDPEAAAEEAEAEAAAAAQVHPGTSSLASIAAPSSTTSFQAGSHILPPLVSTHRMRDHAQAASRMPSTLKAAVQAPLSSAMRDIVLAGAGPKYRARSAAR